MVSGPPPEDNYINSHRNSKDRYLSNAAREKTDVLVPVDLWDSLLALLPTHSGLDPIDELEPNNQTLVDLKAAT
ncbi:hypothetical protein C1752_01487 [Acaryochloris thomasi RCC1774]|uniref:Uncharacterized protein n=1 Tax=Acaryochloris thomasi RCC1774 TaxID=1764569 RepID=A0A2W1JMA3_9CYAN|nr:hypothetical protein [Acaryochloris thomasi]PZD74429.1 hypothetical protein C1752_01487 [Acaryochloris thomasi RCC1774]